MNIPSNQIVSDLDLVQGSIENNRKMQELLYERFAPKMYALCLRYSKNPDDAQDLLQDGFMKIFKNLPKFRGEGSLEGWMRRIFVNTSIEYFRKVVRVQEMSEVQEYGIEDKEWNVLDNLAEKDIIGMLQELSPGYRQVFNMYVIEGYSHKEIGVIMGISEGTSKSQLARAKITMKKLVETRLSKSSEKFKK